MDKLDKAYEADEVELSVGSTDEGYVFDEWEVISGGVTIADDKFTMPDEDVEVKAKFSPISYTVAYDANGGDGQMSDFTLSWGDEQALDACAFTREGYTFAGWQDGDGNTYEDGATVKNLTNVDGSTVTLKAQWTPNAYTVSYDANGGSGTMADQAFTYDAEQALTPCAFTREGYTFAGWNNKADGSGTKVADGISLKLTGDVTLYAQWSKDPVVKNEPKKTVTTEAKKGENKTTKTEAKKNAALPKTGDVASGATMIVTALAGAASLAAGLRKKRQ